MFEGSPSGAEAAIPLLISAPSFRHDARQLPVFFSSRSRYCVPVCTLSIDSFLSANATGVESFDKLNRIHLVRNTRKTVAVSSAPPEGLTSSFRAWWRAAAPFALPWERLLSESNAMRLVASRPDHARTDGSAAVNDVIRDAAEELRRLAGKELFVVTELDPDVGNSSMRPGVLRRLLCDLVSESKRSVCGRGMVTIATEPVFLGEHYLHDWPGAPLGDYAVMSVAVHEAHTDYDAEEHGPDFDFLNLLAILMSVDVHWYVTTEYGQATTLKILLPRAGAPNLLAVMPRETPSNSEALETAADPNGLYDPKETIHRTRTLIKMSEKKTILVVDHEDSTRSMITGILEDAGYEVSEANNGKQAMHSLIRRKAQAVLTELVMPDSEGLELIKELQEFDPEVRVIAMCGVPRADTYLSVARALGARATLNKPLEPGQLLQTVSRVLSD
jgi:CheY-like chemotaxis protein